MTDQKPFQPPANLPVTTTAVPQPAAQTEPKIVPLATYVPPQAQVSPSNSTLPHDADPTIPRVVTEHQVGKYKVEVIRDKCIGAASCVAIILEQNGDDDYTILLSAQSCPTAAIIVTDTSTGEQVWPRD